MKTFHIISVVFLLFIIGSNCDSSPSVIIVGAGPAGIAAASKLLQSNFTNVKILEAEGRIGGRIHSVKFGDAVVDLGAEWCHGEVNNLVYELVKDLDLLQDSSFEPTFYHSSHAYIDQNFAKELSDLFHGFYDGPIEVDHEISLGDYLIEKYNKSIVERYGNDPEKLKFASEFLYTLSKDVLVSEGAFSWFAASAATDWEECEGSLGLDWKGRGYKTILDVLMKIYPESKNPLFSNDNIILNKEVIKIVWDDTVSPGGSVECLDKSVYTADHVIFTPSLGVLKDRYSDLFHPQLPQEKIDAIRELGIGAVIKMFFHFSQRWWPTDDFKIFSLHWAEKDALELLREYSNVPDEDLWHTKIPNNRENEDFSKLRNFVSHIDSN